MTLRLAWLLLLTALCAPMAATSAPPGLAQQNEAMLRELQEVHQLNAAQVQRIRTILEHSGFAGQGNPAISLHPQTPDQCRAARQRAPSHGEEATFAQRCGAPYMAPLYDPRTQGIDQAQACIDQYEFPDIPCAYPVVWIRAREAAQVCEAMGKRLCDAHEWEGACDGRLLAPDYRFDLARGAAPEDAIRRLRLVHNQAFAADKRWSYGPTYQSGVCGTSSHKTPGCPGGGWNACGSNTFPAGAFADCRSPLGVYDLNGNAAEHMNLPLDPSQMASRGSPTLGYTEMKGSWFVFDDFRAHEDWCRWRAPFWHGTRVMDPQSHANYHLGFRCCKTLP